MKMPTIRNQIKYSGILAVLLIVLNPGLAFAQDENSKFTLEVEDLVVPNAPASAIIGSQISLQPMVTPRAFGLSLLNSISDQEGEFPNNIAIELAPYWWSPRPDLTFDNYYNKNGLGQFIRQSLSFSIASEASTITVDDNEIDVTKLGFGLRFALIAGKANPLIEQAGEESRKCLNLIKQKTEQGDRLKDKLNSSEQLIDKDFSILLENIELFKNAYNIQGDQLNNFDELVTKKIQALKKDNLENQEKKRLLKEALLKVPQAIDIGEEDVNGIITEISYAAGSARNEQCFSNIGELNAELRNLDEKGRVGWQLESASAVGFDFRENDFDEFRFRNFATWLTASYRGVTSGNKASPLEFLGVARYTLDEFEDDTDSLFDVGASLVYRLQQTPLSFALEYIRRFGDDGDDRFVGIADYRINNTYSVFVSYGKDFEADFNGNEDLVTLFGLQVGLGRNSAVLVDQQSLSE